MKYTIGIDQSYSKTGYVVVDDNKNVVQHGVITTDKAKDVYDRASDLAAKLVEIVNLYKITDVRIEGLAFGIRGDATRDLAGLQFVVITKLRSVIDNISIKIIPPTTLKRFATGSGKATKQQMIESLPQTIGQQFKIYKISTGLTDVTDGYWLSVYKAES